MVKLLHPEDLVVGQVVVIDVGEPVPVLSCGNSAYFLVRSVEVLVKGTRLRVQFLLHRHNEEGLSLFDLLSLLENIVHYFFF